MLPKGMAENKNEFRELTKNSPLQCRHSTSMGYFIYIEIPLSCLFGQ
jgi:hypothetical protein